MACSAAEITAPSGNSWHGRGICGYSGGMIKWLSLLLAAMVITTAPPALSRDAAPPGETRPAPAPLVATTRTLHELVLPDRRLPYAAVVESLPLSDAKGAVTAQLVVTAYLAEGAAAAGRPVTFAFNGGPGAASAYLSVGAMGPRVLAMPLDGSLPPPPARLQDNPQSWLAFTDLVFIDPVGTGFSRATEPGEAGEKAFWGVTADAEAMAEAIRLWLVRHQRWTSAKFIAGESYGGFRAALVARTLLDRDGIATSGLVLISPALEFSTLATQEDRVLPWALLLPSMAAAARAHGKGDPAATPEAVERFALTDYLTGISGLAADPDPTLIDKVAGLIGLDPALVRRYRGRVPAGVFAERVLGQDGRALSVYDGSVDGRKRRDGHGPDILFEGIKAPLAAAYQLHVAGDLGLATDMPYQLLNAAVAHHWNWEGSRGDSGVMSELADVMGLTPDLAVLLVHGRTDLVTPYMTSRWVLGHLDVPDEARARIRVEVLGGGHMMYLHPSERAALASVAADFYRHRLAVPAQ